MIAEALVHAHVSKRIFFVWCRYALGFKIAEWNWNVRFRSWGLNIRSQLCLTSSSHRFLHFLSTSPDSAWPSPQLRTCRTHAWSQLSLFTTALSRTSRSFLTKATTWSPYNITTRLHKIHKIPYRICGHLTFLLLTCNIHDVQFCIKNCLDICKEFMRKKLLFIEKILNIFDLKMAVICCTYYNHIFNKDYNPRNRNPLKLWKKVFYHNLWVFIHKWTHTKALHLLQLFILIHFKVKMWGLSLKMHLLNCSEACRFNTRVFPLQLMLKVKLSQQRHIMQFNSLVLNISRVQHYMLL